MEYGIVPSSRFDDVVDHLRHNFPDEPLNTSVGLSFKGEPCELLEKYERLTLQESMSVMAVDSESGEIAGVAINGASLKGELEHHIEELDSVDNIPYQRVFGLLYRTNKELDLYTSFGVDKIFELQILSVNSKFRGKGIAKELILRSEQVAIENGFRLIKMDATSFFTQKAAESVGYKELKSVTYGDFKDENGEKIYPTVSPHDYYKVMVKELPCSN